MRFAVLFMPTLLMAASGFVVDHATVAGPNLKELRDRLAEAGIPSEYGGPHANGATEMAVVSFPDGSYLELIAIQAGAEAQVVNANPWSAFLRGNAGPCAWARAVEDLGAETARLRQAGIETAAPARSGRTRPDGVRLEWETARVGEGQGTFFPFLIHDLTPRRLRAFPSGKPSNRDFGGVSRVVIAVRNLDEAVKRYRQAYGLPGPLKQVDRDFGAQLALLGGTPVVLAAPLGADSWLRTRLDEFGEAPCAFVLAARKAGRYPAATRSRWFGADISWFDPDKLGWQLGFE